MLTEQNCVRKVEYGAGAGKLVTLVATDVEVSLNFPGLAKDGNHKLPSIYPITGIDGAMGVEARDNGPFNWRA